MITLSNADSQIVLYAKGHFGLCKDQIESVRALVAHRAGVLPEYINNRDIVVVLMIILNELKINVSNGSFVEQIIFGSYFQSDTSDPFKNFVEAALDLIRHKAVKDDSGNLLVKLESLDSSIMLPQEN